MPPHAESSEQRITHAIFDLDGLLLTTEEIYTDVTSRVVARHGKVFDLTVKAKMMGRKEHEAAQVLINELQLPLSPAEYLKEVGEIQKQEFPKCQVMPGIPAVIRVLRERGIPLAIGTSSDAETFRWKTCRHGDLLSHFRAHITASNPEVLRGKPAPDTFLVAARAIGATDMRRVLVFEDSPTGVRAALSAGMPCIWVPATTLKVDESLASREGVLVVNDLTKFDIGQYLGEWDGSSRNSNHA